MPKNLRYLYAGFCSETDLYQDLNSWKNNVLYIDDYLVSSKPEISGDYHVQDGTKLIAARAFKSCT
jgi:hypothetical protein